MKAVCVYCGSAKGADPVFEQAGEDLARHLVDAGIALVYGGGRIGLMGVLADAVMRLGGQVTGVIPQALMDREVGHPGLTKLHVVKDMHARKAMMAELSDGFIALPGGMGTLEELFEMLTWAQIGLHEKPVGLLNVAGFYDGLLAFLDHQTRQGFIRPEHRQLLAHDIQAAGLLERLRAHHGRHAGKLLDTQTARDLLL